MKKWVIREKCFSFFSFPLWELKNEKKLGPVINEIQAKAGSLESMNNIDLFPRIANDPGSDTGRRPTERVAATRNAGRVGNVEVDGEEMDDVSESCVRCRVEHEPSVARAGAVQRTVRQDGEHFPAGRRRRRYVQVHGAGNGSVIRKRRRIALRIIRHVSADDAQSSVGPSGETQRLLRRWRLVGGATAGDQGQRVGRRPDCCGGKRLRARRRDDLSFVGVGRAPRADLLVVEVLPFKNRRQVGRVTRLAALDARRVRLTVGTIGDDGERRCKDGPG